MADDSTSSPDIAPNLDAPITRRDLIAFQQDIMASLRTFEAHTHSVIVGLFRDLAMAQERVDDVAGDAEQGRAENRQRIAALEARMALCADCPRYAAHRPQEPSS